MKAVGLIVEYNPFHNGHAYHLQSSREAAGADVVIAVMSGNFLQRGEPALVSKWTRSKMALLGGADIVLELPYLFATQKAETFANGAVSILEAAGCESLCFGSENGDISSFTNTLNFLAENNEEFEKKINQYIKTGVSYPKAQSLSFTELASDKNLLNLSKPNNILGYEYIKAIMRQKSSIKPMTIQRKQAEYHDEHFSSATIASATSIRKAIFGDTADREQIGQFIPSSTLELLENYYNVYGLFHNWESYWPLLKFRLLQMNSEELRTIYEIEEGLENRLLRAAANAESFSGFMEEVKTKRYTWTRLQRICVHILTNARKEEMLAGNEKASYLRLLGMSQNGRDYLKKMKSHFSLPLVSRLSSSKLSSLSLDIKAGRIYSCALTGKNQTKLLNMEYNQPPISIP
ncbi:nucleotidyltransferase [Neobacillus sp. PS3-34]|uniref:nucleotidyltransferase n=1 Tax=Neobacillus sp. PS3-34 TaxID=3070678 RepID=UPI0027DF1A26|nr:nucleotidyltransferase [Neobacillus sp. PS3-34]WML49359.1 nucleotidyltransferase [Neobacillus sp. PS3-34]